MDLSSQWKLQNKMHLRRNLIFVLILTAVTALLMYRNNIKINAGSNWDSMDTIIAIDQVGYQPSCPKSGFLFNSHHSTKAELVDLVTGKVMFSFYPDNPHPDEATGDVIQTLDFSKFDREGDYYLRYGNIQSFPFKIARKVHQETIVKLLRSYYLQRCGMTIDDPVTGIYHAPCHLKDGAIAHQDNYHQTGETLDARGGWHDAGDYGKYVSTTAVTIGRLLSLYEQYPQEFWDGQLQIPESGNGIPDLLDEMRVGLDWLLLMQRPDGAVYRKLSGTQWPIGLSPDEDKQPRYIYGISTAETAKFAAVMAMAARVYAPIQNQLAQSYLNAARSGWNFLEANPQTKVDWVDGDDNGSGHYLFTQIQQQESFKSDRPDRFWAASELYITTGTPSFEEYFAQQLDGFEYTLFEWKDPSALGMIDYLLQSRQTASDEVKSKIQEKLKKKANIALVDARDSSYGLAHNNFVWGSNKMTAEEGITLLYAYQLTENSAYLRAAWDQLDYLLGKNHFNQTFITGVGMQPVKQVNHLFARAKQIDIPGLLVGGPNESAEDGIAPKDRGILSYVDDARSYATNEYAIDYNASLISLMVMLQSIGNDE